jgi:hypothetical protein
MVNPIYQQGEGLLLNPFGSKRLGAGAYTAVNSSEFVAQEDTIISVLTGGDAAITENNIDYKTSMNLGSVTLKKGALIVAPVGEAFKSITIDSGVIIAYNCVTGGTKPSLVSILDFGPINVWDSEHVTKVGNVTTCEDFNDVGVRYNLVNPTATNQPTLNTSSSNFNSLPSITFDGVNDYVSNGSVTDYRLSDSTGVFISVLRRTDLSSARIDGVKLTDATFSNRFFNISADNVDTYRFQISLRGGVNSMRGSTNIDNANPMITTVAGAGSVYKMWVNTLPQTVTPVGGGSNDGGVWLDDQSTHKLDVISIGGLVLSSGPVFYSSEWVFSGYFPYTDDAKVEEILSFLQTKYIGTLLLDLYPDAAAAYSLRKLRSAYTGSAIRVRRTDNTEQDIGFVNNELDTVSLLSFVGSGDGFVSKWYTQIGTNDSSQSDTSLQPKIVSSGVVSLENGKATIDFNQKFLGLDNVPYTDFTSNTIVSVAKSDSTTEGNLYNFASGSELYALTYNRTSNNSYSTNSLISGVTYNSGSNMNGQSLILTLHKNGTDTYINSVEGSANNGSRRTFGVNAIGQVTSTFRMNGNVQELVLFNNNQSTDRTAIETNINNFYSIY